jgi:hypothetical protein
MPHTNQASKKAQANMESMQHHFGSPQAFLTVTIDDDNSFLLQSYSGVLIDDVIDVGSLSDEILTERAKARTLLRLKIPGLAAFVFEQLLRIIMEEVVGWDTIQHKATAKNGLFGKCLATTFAVEEQGRKTLHAHILVWTEELKDAFSELYSSSSIINERACGRVSKMFDEIGSTKLIHAERKRDLLRAFDHVCDSGKSWKKRELPEVVNEQQLRNLRHKSGYAAQQGLFAKCPDCVENSGSGEFSNEQLIEDLLIKHVKVPGLTCYPDSSIRRLKAMAVEYQRPDSDGIPVEILHAAYNNHLSFHTPSCFRCNKKNKIKDSQATISAADFECRGLFPKLPNPQTRVELIATEQYFRWDGTVEMRPLYTLIPERGCYDLFQNVCCKAVSESKVACNSNVTFLFPGPYTFYCCKYNMKATQADDRHDYDRVVRTVRKATKKGRVHESNRSEAMRLVLGASYAHNDSNIVSAPMASFLVRAGSRFYFSHQFVFCGLKDMIDTLNERETFVYYKCIGRLKILEKKSYHYLCRPESMEDMCFFDFVAKVEVENLKSRTKNERDCDFTEPFINTRYYEHPSFVKDKMRQGVRLLKGKAKIAKVNQWLFQDSKTFEGDLFDEETIETTVVERHAERLLVLFLPFRCRDDLIDANTGHYITKFRQAEVKKLIKKRHGWFLQNIQDTGYNNLRHGRIPDELENMTIPFQPKQKHLAEETISDEPLNESDQDSISTIEERGVSLLEEYEREEESMGQVNDELSSISFASLCRRGRETATDRKVFCCFPKPSSADNMSSLSDEEPFITVSETSIVEHDGPNFLMNPREEQTSIEGTSMQTLDKVTRQDFLRLYAIRVHVRRSIATTSRDIELDKANGTAKSILNWGQVHCLDKRQQRAFSIIISHFVLTFYEDAASSEINVSRIALSQFNQEKNKLLRLTKLRMESESPHVEQRTRIEQMIMFLHGPGGSGKSTVISLVLHYAQDFCTHLGYPFTKNTIMVTAMSGVAATLLHGRTTHSCCCLCSEPKHKDLDMWKDTRLLIVDEISFASKQDFVKLDKQLRTLKNQVHLKYGGVHVLFAGDFRQLEPVQKEPIYNDQCEQFTEWVNYYVELDGTHRFKKDRAYGNILIRLRNGEVTENDIRKINDQCHYKKRNLIPHGTQYASYDNRTRDRINTEHFQQYCAANKDSDDVVQDALVVFCDGIMWKKGDDWLPLKKKRYFWENCGENDIKPQRQKPRLDPVLKLYRKCRLMLTHNDCVESGRANGTCVVLQGVILKQNETPFLINTGSDFSCRAVYASQVECLTLLHEDDKISPPFFSLKATEYSFCTMWPDPSHLSADNKTIVREPVTMKAKQFPVVRNTGTTGHKLQGKTVNSIFIFNWNYQQKNWPYVVLSRVTTMDGLYLHQKLDENVAKYSVPDTLTEMLENFQSNEFQVSYYNNDAYQEVIESGQLRS